MQISGFDRFIHRISPRWALSRIKARAAFEVMERHYEAASGGRRTENWRRTSGDANAANMSALTKLRELARDLDRNNPWARHGRRIIANHTVGWGIMPKPMEAGPRAKARARKLWAEWAWDPKRCDFEGRLNIAAMQRIVMRTVAQDGEVLVRRRWMSSADGQDVPMQLQLLEADHLDMSRDMTAVDGGGRIIQGVEYDSRGKRVAYWLFEDHPGAMFRFSQRSFASKRVPAEDVLHIFRTDRIGQVRGVTWYAPIIVRLKDFDEYEDATLMRQKIAACFSAFVTDVDGSSETLGQKEADKPLVETLEPGMIEYLPAGRSVEFTTPPQVSDHASFSETELRGVSAGLGVPFTALTGNFQRMPFSAARMERLEFRSNVHEWQWDMLIPQFCDGVWSWAIEAAWINGTIGDRPVAEWTPPPPPMIEPEKEMRALMQEVRNGVKTFSEAIRERGYDPDEFLAEYAEDLKLLDGYGIVLDTDARHRSQQGNTSEPAGGGDGSAGGGDDESEN